MLGGPEGGLGARQADAQCGPGEPGRLLIISQIQTVTTSKMMALRSALAIQILSEKSISHSLK